MDKMMVRYGDVWFADLGIPVGSEQGGKRPVLIVSNDKYNRYSSCVNIVPLTSKDYIGQMNKARLFDYTALLVCTSGLFVLLSNIYVFNKHFTVFRQNIQYFAFTEKDNRKPTALAAGMKV